MSIHLGTEHFIDEICELLERSYPGIRVEFNFTGTERTNTDYLLHYSFPHVPLFVFSNTCPESGIMVSEDLTLAERAAMILAAEGDAGSSYDYIKGVRAHLAELGVTDAAVDELWRAVVALDSRVHG